MCVCSICSVNPTLLIFEITQINWISDPHICIPEILPREASGSSLCLFYVKLETYTQMYAYLYTRVVNTLQRVDAKKKRRK